MSDLPDVTNNDTLDGAYTPTDTRHGTVAGYNRIPCRDECCRRAMANYKKRWTWDRYNGRGRIVSTVGSRRRVGALQAAGWSQQQIAKAAGTEASNMARVLRSNTLTVGLAARIALAYEELRQQTPTGSAQVQSAAHNRARRHGWPPAAAWLNIDDPDETPDPGYRRNRYTAAELVAEYDWLRYHGETKVVAAARLGVSVDAIEKAVKRAEAAA